MAFRAVFIQVDPRGREHSEIGRKVTGKVNGSTEWTFNHRGGTSSSIRGDVEVLGILWRIGLEDRETATVTGRWQDRAEMIEVADSRMKSQSSTIKHAM